MIRMRNEGKRDLWIPMGIAHSHDIKILNYLAFISVKYEVDFERLFDSIVMAWKFESSVCDNLLIECREKINDQASFLITKNRRIVTQFHLPEQLVKEGDLLKEFKPYIYLHSSSKKKYRTS